MGRGDEAQRDGGQQREADHDAERDHDQRPDVRPLRPPRAQHQQQPCREQAGDRRARHGQEQRVEVEHRQPGRRQRAAEDQDAEQAVDPPRRRIAGRGRHGCDCRFHALTLAAPDRAHQTW
jgi:hypothetical protein